MATQLKSIAPSAPSSAPAPNLRVVFTTPPALAATKVALQALPDAVQNRTLDEIAAGADAVENGVLLPLRDLLTERNHLLEDLNGCDRPENAEIDDALIHRVNALDDEILRRDGVTAEDAIVKLITIAQISAEGHDSDEVDAQSAIRAAQKFLGAGYLHKEQSPAAGSNGRLPEGYNQWMSGPYIQWQRHYAQVQNVRSERIAYERDIFEPAYKRYNAVRSLWPWNYDLAADPKAQAALAAVDCMEESTRRDALRDQEHDAIEGLLRCTAPSPAELATKLKLWQQEEGYDLNSAREIVDVLVSDARRFGSHGPFLQSDADLLAAFDTYRAGLTKLAEAPSIGQTDEQHEEACYARMDPAAETMLEKRANTLEGVLAKMRHGLMVLGPDNWVPDVVTAPGSQRLAAGIAMEGMYERMLWSAFQDLARIAGVSLTEQAA